MEKEYKLKINESYYTIRKKELKYYKLLKILFIHCKNDYDERKLNINCIIDKNVLQFIFNHILHIPTHKIKIDENNIENYIKKYTIEYINKLSPLDFDTINDENINLMIELINDNNLNYLSLYLNSDYMIQLIIWCKCYIIIRKSREEFKLINRWNIDVDRIREFEEKIIEIGNHPEYRKILIRIINNNLSEAQLYNLSRDKSIDWDFIISNQGFNWNMNGLSLNPNINIDIIKNNIELEWNYNLLAHNININWDIIKENITLQWTKQSILCNHMLFNIKLFREYLTKHIELI